MEGLFSLFQLFQHSNAFFSDCRLNIPWKHAARLSFIENQIQTCVAIQSPAELEHWYSILGLHLSKHGEEKRIRTHLNDLLGTPEGLMELDDEEPVKETILVGIPYCLGNQGRS